MARIRTMDWVVASVVGVASGYYIFGPIVRHELIHVTHLLLFGFFSSFFRSHTPSQRVDDAPSLDEPHDTTPASNLAPIDQINKSDDP